MIQHQMATSSAIMRRASAELEKRRASLGATRGLRSDGTLDPHYAAILFRDSRGVSKCVRSNNPFIWFVIMASIKMCVHYFI